MTYYHLSKKDLGSQVKLKPRVPDSAIMRIEGNIPRISVSNTIYNCLRGITGTSAPTVNDVIFSFIEYPSKDMVYGSDTPSLRSILSPAVYITEEMPFLPPAVSDFRRNKEHWFIKPTIFKQTGFVNLEQLIADGRIEIVENINRISSRYLKDEYLKTLILKRLSDN